ncbi:unnamed protein product, partial [Symbiodinium microadriaticum]
VPFSVHRRSDPHWIYSGLGRQRGCCCLCAIPNSGADLVHLPLLYAGPGRGDRPSLRTLDLLKPHAALLPSGRSQ